MIQAYIIFILLSILSGIFEAIAYSKKGADAFKWNEHIILVLSRGMWLVLATPIIQLTWIQWFLFSLVGVFGFSFFHNGFYEFTKAKIFKTSEGFFKDFQKSSKTSTAIFNLDFTSRYLAFIFSVIILTAGYFINEAS